MKATFAIGLVYPDGNPWTLESGLTPAEALKAYGNLRETNVAAKNIIVWDDDDPERGYFGPERLSEEALEEWPEYAQAVEDAEHGPDFTAEELRGV